jgi:hypothetical protein
VSNSVLVEEASGLLVEIEDGATVLEAEANQEILVESGTEPVVEEVLTATEVSLESNTATVLEILHVLPTQTVPEEEEVYAKRVDFVSELLIYRGEAEVGTLESEASWRIRRITLGLDDDVTEEWANGNSNFSNPWDNRAILSYS